MSFPHPSARLSGRVAARIAVLLVLALLWLLAPARANAFGPSFLGGLKAVTPIGSTVPENGDVNPYGIVTVPASVGSLVRGDVLISNFNDGANEQGTGTTLVQISPGGTLSLFAQIDASKLPGPCPGGVGLTTALSILPGGYVVVGSLPTSNGKAATAKAGCLIVLDSHGHVVKTIAGGPVNGPWDMTSVSAGPFSALFVTNVLNGTVKAGEEPTAGGTVVRLGLFTAPGHAPLVFSEQVIANGFPERTDPNALVVGPTGVGLSFGRGSGHGEDAGQGNRSGQGNDEGGFGGTLYVADTLGNRIAAVPDALFRSSPIGGGGITIATGGSLKGPLGLTIAPNGNILSANSGDGKIVETTPAGTELETLETGADEGGLFGLTPQPGGHGLYLVNDARNELDLAH